ncbi:hypothetical protein CEY15_17745 [Dietzia natronolimnaea]|uniref:Uncharacterized protein n=1 Tax=Dietzia natronolimnaea TaxID=161920 RepID=A0A2A2WKG1_9ACTN|nr:hypothetical protein [Dietzia natronolimnaea]PAY21672.1 hypothetical protein CEY15_17745 [Dietzia natronolimnaea]
MTSADASRPGTTTYRVTVQPKVGQAPWQERDETLRWPFEVTGNGWTATWHHHRPAAGLTHVTGFLTPDFHHSVAGRPGVVTGRVRRLQLIERQARKTGNSHDYVPGTERLTDLGASPDRYWPRWFHFAEHGEIEESGVLVDLDLDDVADDSHRFQAGDVAAHGTDVWVMDDSAPVLLHLDRSHASARLTEYLLPLAFEPPVEPPGYGGSRQLHADSGGCWITCPAEIVRCDLGPPGEVSIRRVTEDGGDFTVDVDGRLFAITQPNPSMRSHDRYGPIRFDPEEFPFRELVGDSLMRVENRETMDLAWDGRKQRGRLDQGKATRATVWTGDSLLTICTPDGSEETVDFGDRTLGRVKWVRPDPFKDPANADIVDPITFRFPYS